MGKPKLDTSKVGGLAFFVSLIFLGLLGVCNLLTLIRPWNGEAIRNLALFAATLFVGFAIGAVCIRNHLAIFIHELKHAIVANLAGNKARGWRIRRNHGHFEYSFTKETAAWNAFISLAPYWFPLFTIPALMVAAAGWHGNHLIMVACAGLAFGADCSLNFRDVAPHQTDFTNLRGGFTVGVAYTAVMNLTLGTILIAWVLGGREGLVLLLNGLSTLMHLVVSRVR